MASNCNNSVSALYYLYNCQLQTVDTLRLTFVGILFYQVFSRSIEHEGLLTYQATNKRLEMKGSNLSQLFKEPINISSIQHSCCLN